MSVTPFPDPITTNFIPEAWDFTILTRFANFIVTYPIAQNAKIAFQTVYVATTAILTQMANTSYVNSVLNALLSAINTWTGLNTFGSINTGAITTNTITATTLALSGTQLDTPLTPFYSYSAIPFTLANGTYNYGTVGRIGYTIVRANSGGYIGGTPSSNTFYVGINDITLTQGRWLITGETTSTGVNGTIVGVGLNTTNNTNVGGIGFRGTLRCEYPSPTDPPANMSTSAIYYASGTVTMRLLMGTQGYGLTPGKSYLTAIRIA
jgi:hypothetical protein